MSKELSKALDTIMAPGFGASTVPAFTAELARLLHHARSSPPRTRQYDPMNERGHRR